MKEEIKILMNENRNLFIRDNKGVEYNLDVRGYNDMPHFKIMTDEELKMQEEYYKKRIKEQADKERFESAKRRWEEANKPWYKKMWRSL